MEDKVSVNVLFFGKARELSECESSKLLLPKELSYDRLKSLIFEEHFPSLRVIADSCIFAVDQRYVGQEDTKVSLTPSSEIAVIPPLSGG